MPKLASSPWVLRSKSDHTSAWNSKGGPLPQLYLSKERAEHAMRSVRGFPDMELHYEPVKVRLIPVEAPQDSR